MALLGGIMLGLFGGNLAIELLHRGNVAGFRTTDSVGSVLLATLSLHGTAWVLGVLFLHFFCGGLRNALGWKSPNLRQHLQLAGIVLLVALPVMMGLKAVSEMLLVHAGWNVEDQRAIEMFSSVKSIGLKIYLGFFAVIIAPAAEEFLFRGVLFSSIHKMGWPKCAWIVPSLLFALIHNSAPIFLPLVFFALALTWLYQKTGGLLAPILAHSLFNATNLVLLFLQK